MAQVFDEDLVEDQDFPDPVALISELRESPLRADVFTFAQRGQTPEPCYDFPFDWDNLAVLSTTPFENWWSGLSHEARRDVRLAGKRGIAARLASFDDAFVSGIKRIYDETPIRQGRPFWHYHKDLDDVRLMNATYLERSRFVGAYLDDELVGFMKYVRVDHTAVLMQVLAMEAHRDKRSIYALLRHTIELCEREGLTVLTYGKFTYGINQYNSLSEFKRRAGFRELRFPRYFVPLTRLGQFAIATGLHRGVRNMIPLPVTAFLRSARALVLRGRQTRGGRVTPARGRKPERST